MSVIPDGRGRAPHKIVVADPYIELRTGPGRGYPVFHVVDRGAEITIVKRRTDWFEVRTDRGVEGWVHEEQLARTMESSGEPVMIASPSWDDYAGRHWEMSVGFGDFDGASSVSLTGAYRLSANLSAELLTSHISGDFSDGWLAALRLVHTPFPEWRISPYFTLGTGVLQISRGRAWSAPRTALTRSARSASVCVPT